MDILTGWLITLEKWLSRDWLERVALAALIAVFVYSGIDKLLHFAAAETEFNALNLHPAVLLVAATIATQLGASALLCSRRYAPWGALLLAGFTAAATLIAHRFWAAPPNAYVAELNAFLEHIGLIGAFIWVAHLAAVRNLRKAMA